MAKIEHSEDQLTIYATSWLQATRANRIQRKTTDFHIRESFREVAAPESNLKCR